MSTNATMSSATSCNSHCSSSSSNGNLESSIRPSLSSTDATLLAYCIVASMFFATCAYVQCNDPDPEIWIMGYVIGGVMLSIATTLSSTSIIYQCTKAFRIVNFVFLVWWVLDLLPKLEYSLLFDDTTTNAILMTHRMQKFAWSILEFEEGREIGGLLLLYLHCTKLYSFQNRQYQSSRSLKQPLPSSSFSTIGILLLLCSATYLWIYYQPAMNQRYNAKHCNGAFDDSTVDTNSDVNFLDTTTTSEL